MTKLYVLFNVTGGHNSVVGVFDSPEIPSEELKLLYGEYEILKHRVIEDSGREWELRIEDILGDVFVLVMDEYTLNQIG